MNFIGIGFVVLILGISLVIALATASVLRASRQMRERLSVLLKQGPEGVRVFVEERTEDMFELYVESGHAGARKKEKIADRSSIQAAYRSLAAEGFTVEDAPDWLVQPDGVLPPTFAEEFEASEEGQELLAQQSDFSLRITAISIALVVGLVIAVFIFDPA